MASERAVMPGHQLTEQMRFTAIRESIQSLGLTAGQEANAGWMGDAAVAGVNLFSSIFVVA
jgi:hypothetical protein